MNFPNGLVLFCILLISNLLSAGLNGIYTINPSLSASATNYKTFTSAVQDLELGTRSDGGTANGSGVSGPVLFKVSNGTFNEQISIGAITGASALRRIKFESASKDSSKVIISWPADDVNSGNDYTVQLSGAKFITFNKMTIERPGGQNDYYCKAVELVEGCFKDSISNCIVRGNENYTDGYTLVMGNYGAAKRDSLNVIYNNHVTKGGYVIYIENDPSTSSSTYGRKNIIDHNFIDSAYYIGIYVYSADGIKVINNSIVGEMDQSILMYYVQNSYKDYESKISGNYINNPRGDGIYDAYSYYALANNFKTEISNNMVIAKNNAYYNYYGPQRQIVYNSFNSTGTGSYQSGMQINAVNTPINILNNNITSTGGAVAFDATSGYSAISTCNYNNLYSSGSVLGKWNTTSCSTLTAWKSASSKDVNSVSGDPYYINNSDDLHAIASVVNAKATPLSYVTKDYDKEARNATTPDIGCDEFNLITEDASITKMVNPLGGYCSGSVPVKLILKNFGSSNLTSVTVRWAVNGSYQTNYSWTGSLAQGLTTTITVGSYTFTNGSYNLVFNTIDPNGTVDLNTANDTLYRNNLLKGLKGSYTLGGTSPYFTTFAMAVDSAQRKGLCGDVTIKVRDGIYNEQIILKDILTTSTSKLVFIGQSGDSNKVQLNYPASPNYTAPNYVVKFQGQAYVSFKKMTLSRKGTSSDPYADVVLFSGGSSYDSISNCSLRGNKNYNSNSFIINNDYNTQDSFLTIINNKISQGGMAAYFYNYTSYETNNKFLGNTFDSLYSSGIQCYYQSNFEFSNNKVRNFLSPYSSSGVYVINSGSGLIIKSNQIYLNNGGTALIVQNANYNITPSSNGKIYNNMVFTNANGYAFQEYYNNYLDIYYNTFSSLAGYATVYNYNNVNQSVNWKNNIFSNTGGGICFESYLGTAVPNLNYNDYYFTGSILGKINSTTYSTFSAWKSGTGQDANSKNINPVFYNNTGTGTNLHCLAGGINGAGLAISGYTDDIDKETRNASTPDIGADEFTLSPNDAAVTTVISPNPVFCSGTSSVKVVISNYGTNSLSSLSLNIKKNGTSQTAVLWTGTAIAPTSSATISFGSYSFSVGDDLKVFSSQPNGATDGNKTNDTAIVNDLITGLSGTYTIGTGGSYNYTSFTAAKNALVANGVCGNVIFKVANGSYNESVLIPSIPGVSSSATITFESNALDSNKVILNYNSSASSSDPNYTVKLDGSNFITFRKMTIKRSNDASGPYCTAIEVSGGSSNNTFTNCKILGNKDNNSNSNALIFSDNTTDSANTISNNIIKYGYYGVEFLSVYNGEELKNKITGNICDSQTYYSIYTSYQDAVLISKNTITSLNNNITGIYGYYNRNKCVINNNKINLSKGGIGIYLYYMNQGNSPTENVMVYNNFISLESPTNTTDYGIYCLYSFYTSIDFNNIRISSTNANSYPIYAQHYTSSGFNVRNNNFVNLGGGKAAYTSYTYPTWDYNNLYSTGSSIGSYNYSAYASFANWQSGSGFDANGKNINPNYFSANNLHVTTAIINNAGTPIAGITTDYDVQTRNVTTPDIGADEFVPAYNDVALTAVDSPIAYCGGFTPIKVTIGNQGLSTLTTATIKWYVNGGFVATYVYSGTILSGSSKLVKIGSYNFTSGSYTVSAKVIAMNGITDSVPINDSSFLTPINQGMVGNYSIGSGSGNNYSSFTAAINDVSLKGLCGHVVFKVSKGVYNEQITIPARWNSSQWKTVTFTSRANDKDSVTITSPASYSSTDNHTVFLDGAKFIKFKNMTIERTGSGNYHTAFRTGNSAYYDSIIGCKLTAAISSNYGYGGVFYSEGNADTQLYIGNSTIRGGYIGVYVLGNYNTTPKKKITFNNNLVDSANSQDLYFTGVINSYLDGNTFSSTTTGNGYSQLVYFYNGGGTYFTRNKINGINNTGLYMYNENYNYSPFPNSNIANNMISVTGSYTSAFYGQSNTLIDFVNNSFNSTSTGLYNSTFTTYQGSIGKLQNNIFYNSNKGMAIFLYNCYPTIDYNDYYSDGIYFGNWNYNFTGSLPTWKSYTGNDVHSLNVYPEFFSNTDLHNLNVSFNAKATPLSNVKKDIDNQNRNLTTPDIGADEFYLPVSDAGISSIVAPIYYCGTSNNIIARLKNGGTGTLTSASIKYYVNNVLKGSYLWTGSLASAATTDVNIGSYTFTSGVYNLTIKSSKPNGVNDSVPINDSASKINLRAGLKGAYTVGSGGTYDYSSIQMAADSAVGRGVCGNVYMKIATGNYEEKVIISPIPGVSNTAQVTFVSAAADSNKVKIFQYVTYNYPVVSNYIIRFESAAYVNFDSLTIERRIQYNNNNNYYYEGNVVEMRNNPNHISIKNCVLKSLYGYNFYFGGDLINTYNYFTGLRYKANDILIKNNKMVGGINSIYAYGLASNDQSRNWIIQGNIVDSFYNNGFNIQQLSNLSITKNTINKTSYSNNPYGMYITSCDTILKINKNFVSTRGGYGIYAYNTNSSAGSGITPTKFENNMIISGGNVDGNGAYFSSGKYINFYHNSFSNISGYLYSYGLNLNSLSSINVMNNIFSSTGFGTPVYFNTSIDSLNNNDYQFSGSYLGAYFGNNYTSLSAWKTATGKETKSLNIATSYINPTTNLHVSNIAFNGKAKNVSVTEDFDGEVRGTTPDIGADEITPSPYDAGVIKLDSPLTYCGTSTKVKAIIYNYGINTITTSSVGWSINGVAQTPIKWTGSMNTGDSATVTLGFYTFTSPTVYKVKSWTYSPNSTTDGNNYNDTFLSPNIYKGLSGSYLVGTGGVYSTVQSAFNDAKIKGLCGHTILQLKDQVFNEQVKIPNVITASWKTLTLQGNTSDSTKAVIQWPSSNSNYVDNYAVLLDSIDWFTIKSVQIKRTDGLYLYYTNPLEFRNNTTHITLLNNLIKGNSLYSYGNSFNMIAHYNELNLSIRHNAFLYGAPQINGQYNFLPISKINVDSNTFDSMYYGMNFQYASNFNLRGNKFRNFRTTANQPVSINSCGDKFIGNPTTISGNMLDANNCNYGFYIVNGANLAYTAVQNTRFYNNMISGKGSSFSAGLYLSSFQKFDIFNNSFNVDASVNAKCIFIDYNGSNKTAVYNNILKNTIGYAFYSTYNNSVDSMDYNDLFTTGSNFGYYGIPYTSFSTWKLGTTFDSHSKNRFPAYFSYSNLHTLYYYLNGFGKSISYITKDYDGQTRNATVPDIGADEFDLINNDASVPTFFSPSIGSTCNGTHNVSVVFENAGLNTLSSATINWSVDGTLKTPYYWTGTLLAGDSIHLTLGTHNFVTGITNDFKSWTSNPNGVVDLDPGNDTFLLANFGSGIFGTKTIGGSSPDYATFTAAVSDINTWGLCGPLVMSVRDGAYNEQIKIFQYPGSSTINTVTFQSQSDDSSKVTLYYNNQTYTNNYVVMLDGADNVTFRKLTISSAASTSYYNNVVRFENNAHGNFLKNNRIWGKRNSAVYGLSSAVVSSYNYSFPNTYLDYDTGNKVINNAIRGGSYGVAFQTYTTYFGAYESGNSTIGNNIDSAYQGGVYMYVNKDFKVNKNFIKAHPNTSTTYYGVYLNSCYITNYNEAIDVSYNKITSTSSSYNSTGIYQQYCYSFSQSYGYVRVFNNMISINGSSGSYGIYSYYTPWTTYSNNNTYVNALASRGFYLGYGSGGSVKMFNNIWYNNTIGMPLEIVSGFGSVIDSASNNVFKSSGLNVAIWGGTSYNSISSLQSGTSKNANSYNVSPGYTSSTDLHESSCLMKDKGRFITYCNPDIDGQQRGTIMDIGADEFIGAGGTWSGAYDSLWSNTLNWCSNSLPTATNDLVYDPAAVYMPVIDATSPNAKIRDMSLNSGEKLKVTNGGKLSIYGTFLNLAGTFKNPGGTVDYVKSSIQDILPARYANLTVSNGIKTVNGNVTVDSFLTINSGATFPIGSNTLKLGGFFAGIGTITAGSSSSLYVEGLNVPSITLPNALTLSVLHVNRKAGIKIDGGNISIEDSLSLLNGHIYTNTGALYDTVQLLNSYTTTDETHGYYVIGYLKTAPRILPLSTPVSTQNGITYTRNTSANPGTIVVTRVMGANAGMFNSYPLKHLGVSYVRSGQMWVINASGTKTGLDITTKYDYVDSAFALNGRAESLLNVYSRNAPATEYEFEGRTSINTSTNVIMSNTGHFTEYILGGGVDPLPVTWLNFNAVLTSPTNSKLDWSTAIEENNDRFDIERSENGTNFIKIGEMKGKGTVYTKSDYTYNDQFGASISSNVLYYRLKQIDFNGEFSYSEIRKVNLSFKINDIKVFMDQSTHKLNINIIGENEKNIAIRMNDLSGKELLNNTIHTLKGFNSNTIDMNSYAKGMYQIIITEEGKETKVFKVMKY